MAAVNEKAVREVYQVSKPKPDRHSSASGYDYRGDLQQKDDIIDRREREVEVLRKKSEVSFTVTFFDTLSYTYLFVIKYILNSSIYS